jgi:phenylpropionate dioxygenase-like ring-hydroxylating dioxygenase large terminal subunit
LPDFPHLPANLQRVWRYFTVLPNMAFDVYPDMMDFFQVLPAGPGRCIIRSGAYALPDDRRATKAARWLNERINAQVQAEDNALTLAVQRGLMSSSYTGGYLSTKERWLKQFQDLVREKLPVANLAHAPAPGSISVHNRDLLLKATN